MTTRRLEPLEGFDPRVGLLLSSLHDSTRKWRRELGEVPAEAVVWQPAPDAHSIGALILHMIDAEAYWFESVAARRRRPPGEASALLSRETHQYGGKWPSPPAQPLEWYLAWQDRVRERAISRLVGLDPDALYKRSAEVEVSLVWIVSHIVQHDSYTGGQAVLVHELWKKRHRR